MRSKRVLSGAGNPALRALADSAPSDESSGGTCSHASMARCRIIYYRMEPDGQHQPPDASSASVATTTVDTVADYINVAKALRDEWRRDGSPMTWHPWFRGQPNTDWPLTPGILRTLPKRSKRAVREDLREELVLRQEFERRGRQLSTEQPQNCWEWYFLMQHYGVPTRLLDWTDGALIALYFAVRPRSKEEGATRADSAVWVIDPWYLNAARRGISYEPRVEEGVLSPAQVPREYFPLTEEDLCGMPSDPIAVHPPQMARRLAVQRSRFILFGADPTGIETVMGGDRRFHKIIMRQYSLRSMFWDLQTCGISQSTLFPDLEGLGSELRRAWKTGSVWG